MTRARHRFLLPALFLLTACAGTRVTRDETIVMRLPRVAHECHPAPRFAVGGALLREGERTLLVRLERAQTCTTVRGEDQLIDVDVTEGPDKGILALEVTGALAGGLACSYALLADCHDIGCGLTKLAAGAVGCPLGAGLGIATAIDARPTTKTRVHERRTEWGDVTDAPGANVPAAAETIGVVGPWGRIDATTDARGIARVELPETVDVGALVRVEVVGESGERATLRVRRAAPPAPAPDAAPDAPGAAAPEDPVPDPPRHP